MSGLKRNTYNSISYLLKNFPAVAVLGARQVGKSTLLRQIWPNASLFDLEVQRHFDQIEADTDFFLSRQAPPLIFDESQLAGSLFRGLRVAIDRHRDQKGQYLLSGSSSPQLLQHISETLAGRIALIELNGFTLNEAYEQPKSALYASLNSGDVEALEQLPNRVPLNAILEHCFYGGYPEPFLNRHDAIFHDQWYDNYFRTYIDRDVRSLFPNLQLTTYQRFVRMLAVNSGQVLNASQFAKSLDVSQPTIKNYIEIAAGTFLWRKLPAYYNNLGKRLVKMSKGHIRDSGLLCRLMSILSVDQLLSHPMYGHIWEAFVAEQIISNMQSELHSVQFYHYRTQSHAEIDLILEGRFGVIPIEIKAGVRTQPKQVIQLTRFVEEYKCPVGLVINQSDSVEWLNKSVLQIPAGAL